MTNYDIPNWGAVALLISALCGLLAYFGTRRQLKKKAAECADLIGDNRTLTHKLTMATTQYAEEGAVLADLQSANADLIRQRDELLAEIDSRRQIV